jgi:hypothetical protein
MLQAFWLAGAIFAGLMGGVVIASVDVEAKWWEALSAIGTIIAAVGTVGTLAYQALQNARVQALLRAQLMQQEFVEAEQLEQWMRDLVYVSREMYRIIKQPDDYAQVHAAAAREKFERAHDGLKGGKVRISSKMGLKLAPLVDASYRFGLEIATSLAGRPFHDREEKFFSDLSDLYDQWSNALLEIEKPLHAWRRDLESRVMDA